jgi:hypothetical protein
VIVALLTPSAHAAQQATRDIPIVFNAGDAVRSGLVASLARPGGNMTGVSVITSELHGKCVELFHDMLPSALRIGTLINAVDISSGAILDQIQQAGHISAIEIAPVISVRSPGEIDAAFATMKQQGADAAVVQGSLGAKILAERALEHRVAAATAFRPFAEAGGLMSYSASFAEAFRTTALFVVKILQGAKPADLPVEQPTTFDLVINLKTQGARHCRAADAARPGQRGDRVRRRELITLWERRLHGLSRRGRSSQGARVDFIEAGTQAASQLFLDAFRGGLSKLGWVEGQNLVILDRWAEAHSERLPGIVTELHESTSPGR